MLAEKLSGSITELKILPFLMFRDRLDDNPKGATMDEGR